MSSVIIIAAVFGGFLLQVSSHTNSSEDVFLPPGPNWSNEFDWLLFKEVAKKEENVVTSPASLRTVLQILYEGASVKAKRKIQSVVNIFPIQDTTSEADGNVLKVSSQLFLQTGLQPYQPFQQKIRDYYKVNLVNVDFSDENKAAEVVNNWAENATEGRIEKIVDAGSVHNALLMIANAVYFKGNWVHPFPVDLNKKGPFHGSAADVTYMWTIGNFHYRETDEKLNAEILRLPYMGNRYAMYVVLPKTPDGLRATIANLDVTSLRNELQRMTVLEIAVGLPKFTIGHEIDALDVLGTMGLREVFQSPNSFPFIAERQRRQISNLTVTNMLQKSGVEVDEEGTVAYAVTIVKIENRFGEQDGAKQFHAKHPFVFFLEDQTSGKIVFAGKVVNPVFDEDVGNRNVELKPAASSEFSLQPVSAERLEDVDARRFSFFDLELLNTFSGNDNFVVSPASIKLTLAMLLEGSGGVTAEEIRKALRIPPNTDISKSHIQRLLNNLRTPSAPTIIQAANAVFVSKKYRIDSNYNNQLQSVYKATVNTVDFSNSVNAADAINSWVSSNTDGFIRQLVSPATLSGDKTAMILNALYFRGEWEKKFSEDLTNVKCFKSLTKDCVHVHMMQAENYYDYNYIQQLDAHAVVLPYNDKVHAMLIVLPSEHNTVQGLARDLQYSGVSAILSQLESTEIFLELPKFQIEFESNIVGNLQALKIQNIFNQNANLSGIVRQEQVQISDFLHKVRIDVNEQGSEAAAVSGAVVVPLMGSSRPRIIANRPFVFVIYNVRSQDILFEGQLVEPQEIQNNALPKSGINGPAYTQRNFGNSQQRLYYRPL